MYYTLFTVRSQTFAHLLPESNLLLLLLLLLLWLMPLVASRRGHDVLRDQLPAKEEHVILVRLSPVQRALYTEFMKRFREAGNNGWLGLNPLKAFCVCCKVQLFSCLFSPPVLYRTLIPISCQNVVFIHQQPSFVLTLPDLESPGRAVRSSAEGESGKRAGPGPRWHHLSR